jgi:hypothetical protein
VPRITIESEVRPYLNSLIENGASFVWLQLFYQKNIKLKVAQAIDALPVSSVQERIRLLRLFTDNQAINYPESHQKLMPIRILFRHSDSLAADLQNTLSKEILLKFTHPPTYFLAQNAEKILETLVSIQILLEIRERFKKAQLRGSVNYKKIIEEQEAWLKREIHSRVPIAQREMKADSLLVSSSAQKWQFSKGYFGYDTGPGSLWYFFNGEIKLVIFLQREILNLIVIGLTFRDWVKDIAKEKFAIGKILLYSPMATFIFFLQLMNLALLPYRLFRTALAEVNQFIYHSVRSGYEHLFPKQHCNKPLLYAVSLALQITLYTGLLLHMGLPMFVAPFSWTNPVQAALMTSTLLVVYNGAMLTLGLGKYIYDLKKQKNNIALDAKIKPPINISKQKPLENKRMVYVPSLVGGIKVNKSLKLDSSSNMPVQASKIDTKQKFKK